MHLTRLMMGLILLLLFFPVTHAQILSPTAQVSTQLPSTALAVTIGQTTITGPLTGIDGTPIITELTQDLPISDLLTQQYNLSLDDLYLYPLLAPATIQKTTKITVIELGNLDLTNPEDLLTFLNENIQSYTNADLTITNGFSIFGTNQPTTSIDKRLENSITSTFAFPLTNNLTSTFLALIPTNTLDLTFTDSTTLLYQPTDTTNIQIRSQTNELLYTSTTANTIYIIDKPKPTISMDAMIHLLPLPKNTQQPLALTISPSNQPFTNIPDLITDLQNTITEFSENQTFELPIEGFTDILDTASNIINGALILYNTSTPLTIDTTTQTLETLAFLRGNTYTLTIQPTTHTKIIEGEFKLIFIDDHFYTTQAPTDTQGITLPWIPIGLWIIAIALIIATHTIITKKDKPPKNSLFKQPLNLLIHIIALIITFILVDLEISFQFGTSALSILTGQGINLIFLALIALQLIMWVLGYLLLTIPLRLILTTILPYITTHKPIYTHLIKTSTLLLIWVFTAIYIKLLINYLLLIIGDILPTTIG